MVGRSVEVQDLKERFQSLQAVIQSTKEEKIRVESELKTLRVEYDEQLRVLLEATGVDSLEKAVAVYQERSKALEKDKLALEQELDGYLDTYGEES